MARVGYCRITQMHIRTVRFRWSETVDIAISNRALAMNPDVFMPTLT